MKRSTLPLLTLCVLTAPKLALAQLNWTPGNAASPQPLRSGHAASFARIGGTSRIVMLGGLRLGSIQNLSDSWMFDGFSWTQINSSAVSPRSGHAMAWDPARERVVMFGGPGPLQNETFELGPAPTWTQIQSAAGPAARTGHAMAFFSRPAFPAPIEGVVMVGGRDSAGALRDQTFLRTGSSWTDLTAIVGSPGAREGHAMAFDSVRQVLVLFGGRTRGGVVGDTWEFNGSSWTQRSPATSPNNRVGARMVFDESRRTILLFGSASFGQRDTWEFDGTDWTNITGTTGVPAIPNDGNALTYDPINAETVLVPGSIPGPFVLDNQNPATVTPFVAPFGLCRFSNNDVLTLDKDSPGDLPWVGSTFELVGNSTNSLGFTPISFIKFGFSNSASALGPLPFHLNVLGAPGCFALVSDDATSAAQLTPTFRVPIPIVNNPALVGLTTFAQAVSLEPAANALGLVVSNGVEMTIGQL